MAITNILENMSQTTPFSKHDDTSNSGFQPQLLMLRILAACMQHHWKHLQSKREKAKRRPALQRSDAVGLPEGLSLADPPQLDESLAKHIIHVISRILSQVSSLEDREQHGFVVANESKSVVDYGPSFADMHQASCRVLAYVSASNWNTTFSMFRSRILHLTSTSEENPEVADIMMLECASLNSKRLSMVLTELCASTLHLKKPVQQWIAVALRKAIWNWIESYTAEFMSLCHNQRRLEGSPEILFDIFNSLADTAKKKAVFWPVQTMLLVLCPDIMFSTSIVGGNAYNKKAAFLSALSKAMKGDRMGELAAICYVDLCRAATYVSKDEMTAICQIVPDVENDLIDKLFDPHRYLSAEHKTNSLGVSIDYQRLMADCIVAMFRLDVERTVNTLIPLCFEFTAPTIFKVSVVKAAVMIASEENQLPWIASISALHGPLCSRIRTLFLEYYQSELREKSDTSSQSSRKGGSRLKKEVKTASSERFELILDVLHLYQTDPQLAILGNDTDRYEQNAAVMVAITRYLSDASLSVREAASDCLTKLHAPDYILLWGPPNRFMEFFWKISSEVQYTLAKQLLLEEKDQALKILLELLKRILTLRNQFLECHSDVTSQGIDIRERWQASVALEVALLVLLCSSDTSICTLAIECFGLLCNEVRLTEILDDYQPLSTTIVQNMGCYTELTHHVSVVTGRKSQQRRIRGSLRTANPGSPGLSAAWEEVWRRWKRMTPLVVRSCEEMREESSEPNKKTGWHDKLRNTRHISSNILTLPVDEDRSAEWQNYAGFLAALGGVCLMTAQNEEFTTSQSSSTNSYCRSDSTTMVEQFVMKMVELLACDNLMVREWVREILGNDLSSALYHILFRDLEVTMSNGFSHESKNEPICSSRYALFVEQTVSVLKLILDRTTDKSESLFVLDFSTLIRLCTFYVNKLPNDTASMKMKIKLCQLIEVLMAKKDRIILRQEFRLRNKLLEIITEWTSDYLITKKSYLGSQSSFTESSRLDKLQQDLDLACLKTIVALLHQLPLQPLEAPQESNAMAAKSRIFFKYFTYFFKILNRCRVTELNSLTRSRSSLDFRANSELAPLKNYTILALSNMLSANVDAGLKYSFSMGYHEDNNTRTAFMEVLSNILNQGTEFETLAETVMTDRYEKLIDIIVYSDLNITISLCEICPSAKIDNVASVLLACYASRNKTMQLFKVVIQKEVETTDNETDLFRRTSIATRLLSAYAKEQGSEYMRAVLLPVFQKLFELPRKEKSFELDPTKLSPGENIQQNTKNVILVTDLLLQAICNSVDLAPLSFREICHIIVTSVRERFPEVKYTAAGSFIFLRFFCPAIVSPESVGLLKNSNLFSREMRRGFLMATKVIQNLANNVLFGAKETYMIALNDFLTDNIYKVATFLREMSTCCDSADSIVEDYKLNDEDYIRLHHVLTDNMEHLSKDLATRRYKHIHDLETLTALKREFDRFANILAQLGRPPQMPKKKSVTSKDYVYAASNQLYANFMRRNSDRGVESSGLKNVFYEGSVSKSARTVFYLIMRHIQVDSIDLELLVYHIIRTLEANTNGPFEILIDFTLFCKDNEIPAQWFNQLMQLASEHIIDNISALHLYNPNSYLRTYLKKSQFSPLPHKLSKRMFFAVTLTELQEHIQRSEIKLPDSTLCLETDPSAVFFPVHKIIQYKTSIPLTMKVSAEYVQIMTVRKQEIIYGVQTILNDVYHISEIEQVTLIQHDLQGTESANEFGFKTARDSSIIIFSSPKREAIINTIRQSKRRYESSQPTTITERTIRPNDVPGRLLNMALLNLGSSDPNLRLSSYRLLYALTRAFNFDVDKQLLDAKDLCLPANSTDFIVNISERIAAKEPLLTLEFLNECVMGYTKSEEATKYLVLLYMMPWLSNLSYYCGNSATNTMTKLVQAKIWKSIANVDDILNMVIDTFLNIALEYGIGSRQAEVVADTLVTLSNVTIRSKLLAFLRRVLNRTSFNPTRSLTDHETWPEIAILVRFLLMISFNNRGPLRRVMSEVLNIVTLMAGIGPTLVRASVHGIIINLIQSLCTRMPVPAANVKKLQLILTELSDSKSRLLFGLNRTNANAFAIASETLNDTVEPISLSSVEIIVSKLSEVMNISAPNTDILNYWRARWMSLVTSTAFQFNPAIQPRSFIILGYLGREEIDDDLLYQILVALRGALAIFNESDPNLVVSIMMCLKNLVENLPSDSIYLLQLFWIAVTLVELNSPSIFATALELLEAVFRSLDAQGFFIGSQVSEVLLSARAPIADITQQLDGLCGVNFESHFSFAIAGIMMKGMRYSNMKMTIYNCLYTFLSIERKQHEKGNEVGTEKINTSILGYITALLPMAAKDDAVDDLLKLAGISENVGHDGKMYEGIFDKLDVPDNITALLVISLLATMNLAVDTESERLFIYGLLSEAAISIPEVFVLIYDSLLPKMNQIVVNSQTKALIECVKSILVTACSNPSFSNPKDTSQKALLDKVGFSALCDSTFGVATSSSLRMVKPYPPTDRASGLNPTLFPYISDLPGKLEFEPDGYMLGLIRDPQAVENGPDIKPLDSETLRDAFSLREGPIPGFDASVLGTDDATTTEGNYEGAQGINKNKDVPTHASNDRTQ
ncbi:hypothetical protein G6F62_000155 [Rhizopus arrhizus]|uniref:Ras-GAP domain-containing protein n=1 Tax=Rhizopus oryzae TaxID=64495 RepID=A0A9P6XJB1_RHIOR|nr:hypothetical protein G6F23_002286 [Rhizopus arrhizus]KAG0970764.1 hypothetical protein G6F31_000586 [Rhizopus arrhizus]KAG1315289.1 hypothetical protein G6F64_000789 [Rhizopus arrhizus]KAG1360246.1 hypothetical protein G6F62_000155 [Rhizopus arrhizus]